MREMAVLQDEGASELLTSNSQITAAGYVVDGVLTLSGAKVVQLGSRAITGTVAKVGASMAQRTVTQAATSTTTTGGITRIVGRDILAGPAAARAPVLQFTSSELTRLVTRGANLTGPEIIKKAELYLARATAKNSTRRAIENGAPEAVVAPLREEFLRLNALIENAIRAAHNLP
jgi:hypothetical protein